MSELRLAGIQAEEHFDCGLGSIWFKVASEQEGQRRVLERDCLFENIMLSYIYLLQAKYDGLSYE